MGRVRVLAADEPRTNDIERRSVGDETEARDPPCADDSRGSSAVSAAALPRAITPLCVSRRHWVRPPSAARSHRRLVSARRSRRSSRADGCSPRCRSPAPQRTARAEQARRGGRAQGRNGQLRNQPRREWMSARTSPAATAAAEPPDEPPGTRCRSLREESKKPPLDRHGPCSGSRNARPNARRACSKKEESGDGRARPSGTSARPLRSLRAEAQRRRLGCSRASGSPCFRTPSSPSSTPCRTRPCSSCLRGVGQRRALVLRCIGGSRRSRRRREA